MSPLSVTRRPSLIQSLPLYPTPPSILPATSVSPVERGSCETAALSLRQLNSHCCSISSMTQGLLRCFYTSHTDRPQATTTEVEDREVCREHNKLSQSQKIRLLPLATCTNCSDSYYRSHQRHYLSARSEVTPNSRADSC